VVAAFRFSAVFAKASRMDVGFATGVEDGVSEGVVGAEVSPLGALGAETGVGESATALVVLVSSMCVGPYSVWCCLPRLVHMENHPYEKRGHKKRRSSVPRMSRS
jgi:hypothetical protein